MHDLNEILVFDLETTLDHKTIHMSAWDTIKRGSDGRWTYVTETSQDVSWCRDMEDFRSPYTDAYAVAGHNSITFDCPVLHKVAKFGLELSMQVDTLLLAQMLYPDNLGGHSLAKLVHLVGEEKMVSPDFETFTPEMVTYGKHDVFITCKLLVHLLNRFEDEKFSWSSYEMEREVKVEVALQEDNGFRLNIQKATLFRADLNDRVQQIEEQVKKVFYPQIEPIKGTPKARLEEVFDLETTARVAARFGIELKPTGKTNLYRITPVNLGSRPQLAQRLIHAGWQPIKYTALSLEAYNKSQDKADLTPIIDESTLEDSTVPEAKLLSERFKLTKTLAFVDKWLELVRDNGRVHGRVMSIGAPTARMSHFLPNMAQVPKVGKIKGQAHEDDMGFLCRDCWYVEDGNVLTGVDASGLELRALAHYANDPEMSKEILDGDIHTKNQEAVGLETRDQAKTFIYAWLYGGGPAKLGAIAGKGAGWGKTAKTKLIKRWKGIGKLLESLEWYIERGYVPGIDGRKLYIRKAHATLNTLLQGCGAIVMKQALLHCTRDLREAGIWFKVVANVHDEFQIEHRPEDTEQVQKIAKEAIVKAGVTLGLRVPLAGEAKTGASWAHTH
jgi:DNA polymerase I